MPPTMPKDDDFPKPKFVTGGCLCGALRYRADFPEGHDFDKGRGLCQCTQCRRNTSSLFFLCHRVAPFSTAWHWLDPSSGQILSSGDASPQPAEKKEFRASAGAARVFCGRCGSMICWKPDGVDRCSFAVGTVDPLYLWGEGADKHNNASLKGGEGEGTQIVPRGGFARALVLGRGSENEWCANEIPGVTDPASMALLGVGSRYQGDA